MKKIQYILILAATLVFGYSCDKELESEGVSRTTNYLTYDLTGGDLVTIPVGTAYVEPGFKAMEGQTDVSSSIEIDGEVDGNTIGLYSLTYSGKNSDGFSSSTERKIVVYDPNAPATDISGDYISNVARVAPARAFKDLSVSIEKLAPGFFYVSDFIGGYYDQGAGYGSAYAVTGYFLLNADNTITHVSSYNQGWGDSLNDLVNGIYDPTTKSITWDAFYVLPNNFNFKVVLVKEEE